MENFEQMLQSVLSDPEKMQQIMGLAQSLGGSQEPPKEEEAQPVPELPPLGELAGLLQKAGIDSRQQALLSALAPYMSSGRVEKLRRAMQAAKVASMASRMLTQRGGPAHV